LGERKIVYIQTSGAEAPERTYAPFLLATAAAMKDIDTTIFFMINGSTILRKGAAEKIRYEDKSPAKKFMDLALEAGVKFLVCHQSLELHDMKPEDLIEEAEVSAW
jgi:hypothetical protein